MLQLGCILPGLETTEPETFSVMTCTLSALSVLVLMAFVCVGYFHVQPHNWTQPPGFFTHGFSGTADTDNRQADTDNRQLTLTTDKLTLTTDKLTLTTDKLTLTTDKLTLTTDKLTLTTDS
ncbi:hypothetical protein ACOMHN_049080 [Nucella lapillus]